jgi:hypothetical protein
MTIAPLSGLCTRFSPGHSDGNGKNWASLYCIALSFVNSLVVDKPNNVMGQDI